MSLAIFLIFLSYGSIIEGGNVFIKYQLQPQILKQTCKSTDAIGIILAQSYLVCAHQCYNHPGCVSFFYSNMTMVCDRCNTTYDVMDDVILDVEGSSVYYSIKGNAVLKGAEEIVEDTTLAEEKTSVEDTTVAEGKTSVEDTTVGEETTSVEETTAFEVERLKYTGCYSVYCDEGGTRCEASYEVLNMDAITVHKCYEICNNYALYFSISMTNCYCDMYFYTYSTCSTPCVGDLDQECGGPGSQSVYRIKSEDGDIGEDTKVVEDDRFGLEACFSVYCNGVGEPVYRCEASYQKLDMDAITVIKCYEFCKSGALYFSVSMTDCDCDMPYYAYGTCTTPCAGDPDQTCGGPDSVIVYMIKSWD